MIMHITEVNLPVQYTDYMSDRTGLLSWKYRFTWFYKLDDSLSLFEEAISDLRNKLYHIPNYDIAVSMSCL